MKTTVEINTNFLKEWKPFQELEKKAEMALLRYCMKHKPTYMDKERNPITRKQVDDLLGLAYTSSGDYAGLWLCNGCKLKADETHDIIGIAINELGEVIAIAWDDKENEIFIKL